MRTLIIALTSLAFFPGQTLAQQCSHDAKAVASLSEEVERVSREFDANDPDAACQSMKSLIALYKQRILTSAACGDESIIVNTKRSLRSAYDTVARVCEIASEWPDFISHTPREPVARVRPSTIFHKASLVLLPESTLAPDPSAKTINFLQGNLKQRGRPVVQTIAIVDEDGRMTEERYAPANGILLSDVQARFAATGTLRCGKWMGSAQLTGDNSTITTAAHMFIDINSCKMVSMPGSCRFTIRNRGHEKVVAISELSAMGFGCPKLPREMDDWALLKLENPIAGVVPYKLPNYHDKVKSGDAVIAVNGRNADYFRMVSKKKMYPKTIEECWIRETR